MAQDASSQNTILILGASYAGVSTAHYLLKHVIPKLPSPSSYQVTLVSPSNHTVCRPACPRALISDSFFDQSKLFVSIPTQFTQYPSGSFRFIQASATNLDTENCTVSITPSSDENTSSTSTSISSSTSTPSDIKYHTLILATGSSTPSPLLGLNTSPHPSLHKTWSTFREALPTAHSIIIAGGGPSAIETAGELGEYLNGRHRSGWFTSTSPSTAPPPKVKITVLCSSPKILPILRPGLASKAENLLKRVGVEVRTSTTVVAVSPQDAGRTLSTLTSKATVQLSTGESIPADLYIPATGIIPNTAFVPRALIVGDGDLRIRTHAQTFRVQSRGTGDVERIYSIGDCSSAFRPAVHNILAAVPILCQNIKKDLLKDLAQASSTSNPGPEIPDALFKEDVREMQLVPIGSHGGVGAAMGWALPGWLVWAIKGRDYWVWTTGRLWSGRQWG